MGIGFVDRYVGMLEDNRSAIFYVTSKGITRSEPSFHNYLIPCELPWKLPVEQTILVQVETFVDQKVLRGKGGRRISHRKRVRVKQQDEITSKQARIPESMPGKYRGQT